MEHEERAQQLEHEADRMENESERIGEHIDDARRDWEAKERDRRVPGAQPGPGQEEDSIPGVETDEDELTEQPGP
ncbi:MAG: hypothetical protein ICV69_05325 [Thermoleophilaceae bacterium]|nr:hypothetical protein [Thermoleophilaceae bacterium]